MALLCLLTQAEDELRRDVQVTVASVPSLIQDSSQNEVSGTTYINV